MSQIRNLLIDLDGTLLGSRDFPLHVGFISGITRKSGFGLFRTLKALRAMRKALEAEGTGVINETRAHRAFGREIGLSDSEAKRLLATLVTHTFAGLGSCFYPIPGATDFLEWAQNHFTLHLATNPIWPRSIVELRLKWAGVDPNQFKFMANAEIMHSCKPSLHYYRELLETLNVTPAQCLMIGDSRKKDGPATKVGIPVFLLGKEASPFSLGERTWSGSFFALRSFLESQ